MARRRVPVMVTGLRPRCSSWIRNPTELNSELSHEPESRPACTGPGLPGGAARAGRPGSEGSADPARAAPGPGPTGRLARGLGAAY
jgi:hypothetical protein